MERHPPHYQSDRLSCRTQSRWSRTQSWCKQLTPKEGSQRVSRNVVSEDVVGRISSTMFDPEGELGIVPFPSRDSVFPSRFQWL